MSSKLVNLGNHAAKSLNDCTVSSIPESLMERDQKKCDDKPAKNDWIDDLNNKKTGLGIGKQRDPMQAGKIVNDVNNPNRNVVYRYSQGIRACDEAMIDLFKAMVVLDDDGKAHPIPIIWASQEKAVAAIIADNYRKDDSLVVDRIKLPMLAIYSNNIQFNQSRYVYHKAVDYLRYARPDNKPGFAIGEKYERDTVFGRVSGIPIDISYTLYAWTLYIEDMNQLIEQILSKFSPMAYIQVRGVQWETGVKLNSIANNLDIEPGDQNLRVVKYEFNLTAETYIPQPLVRHKAVLKTKLNIFDTTDPEQMVEAIDRLEEAVEELK